MHRQPFVAKDRTEKEVAVFVNGRALKYSEYDTTYLSEQDEVRILRPLGGG